MHLSNFLGRHLKHHCLLSLHFRSKLSYLHDFILNLFSVQSKLGASSYTSLILLVFCPWCLQWQADNITANLYTRLVHRVMTDTSAYSGWNRGNCFVKGQVALIRRGKWWREVVKNDFFFLHLNTLVVKHESSLWQSVTCLLQCSTFRFRFYIWQFVRSWCCMKRKTKLLLNLDFNTVYCDSCLLYRLGLTGIKWMWMERITQEEFCMCLTCSVKENLGNI